MSYFRHWKSTHNERKQVEKAKEQGAHVRRKRGLRRLPDDYDDKASSNYDDRNWKTQSKRRKQFREGIIEAIVAEEMRRTSDDIMSTRAMVWAVLDKPNWLEKNIKDKKKRHELFMASLSNAEKRLAKLRQTS
jgi:hypothetical protein